MKLLQITNPNIVRAFTIFAENSGNPKKVYSKSDLQNFFCAVSI